MADVATRTKTKMTIKTPSMWKVILHNDDFTPMDFVVAVLMQIFGKSLEESVALMLTVHNEGRAVVSLYTREIAETKVRETMTAAQNAGHPLLATAEEA